MTTPSARPIRIDPAPGESLESWIARVADANLVPRRERPRSDRDARKLPTKQRIASASAWSGARHPATDMTLYAYPWGVRGRADRARVRSWRVEEATWVCPLCTTATGVRLRDWALACHPLCLTCGSLLIDARDAATGTLRRADAKTLDIQRRVVQALDRVRVQGPTRTPWRATYRLATLIALTADDHWPRLPTWESDVRADLGTVYRDWQRCPPADPAQAAWVVFEAWRGTESPARGRRLIAEGWDRLLEHPAHEVRQIGDTHGVLPERPQRLLLAQRDAAAADATLKEMVRAVRRLRMSTGLNERHIPSWCVTADDLAPPERDWTDRAHLAVVLHALCSGAAGRGWSGERRAVADLQLSGLEPSAVMRLLREGRGIALDYARLVVSSADYLASQGLIDYRERRRALWPMVHRGRVPDRPASLGGVPEQRLADWIWVHATRGPVPRSATRTREAVALDGQLDPEMRLHLVTAAFTDLDGAATVDVALDVTGSRVIGELA
ncbi:MAG: TniQ family protein [Cellulomonas sp.]|nr:TniQ family protein [Cellulomonas sp.]MCR6649176.1 TniQ family protein [Cellulomonas sp.]